MKKYGVKFITGVTYEAITKDGIIILKDGKEELISVDQIVVCAGQESVNSLEAKLKESETPCTVIGGALNSRGIDAQIAIREGVELGLSM